MLRTITQRLRQGYRTVGYPHQAPVLPERFRGKPHIDAGVCTAPQGCTACASACPANAIRCSQAQDEAAVTLDLGACTFCGACSRICPHQAIQFTTEYRLAATTREDLLISSTNNPVETTTANPVTPVQGAMLPFFRRSLRIRQVSAAGCNACEADCNVLGTIVFDLPRFGIDYVASPRHADAMLITGPVSTNMQLALRKCYAVMPPPKVVIAVGSCAISGGLFQNLQADGKGAAPHLEPDLFIPGCPPHPYTILDGLLRFIDKLPEK